MGGSLGGKAATMDKQQFLKQAPWYYAVAVTAYMHSHSTGTRSDIEKDYYIPHEDSSNPEDGYNYVEKRDLLDEALRMLVDLRMLQAKKGAFGPAVYEMGSEYTSAISKLHDQEDSPFHMYQLSRFNYDWLLETLREVNLKYDELKIDRQDFDRPEREWEPLPLDRDDPALKEVTQKLDETIEQVRSDNGYSATLPQERDYVLENLGKAAEKLKTSESVAWGYLQRTVLEPLKILLQRFKGAATGSVAAGLRGALEAWIKSKGLDWLNDVWKWFW